MPKKNTSLYRKCHGFSLTRKSETRVWEVTFTLGRKTVFRSTGETDAQLAEDEAARIVRAERAGEGERIRSPRIRAHGAKPIDELLAEWLVSRAGEVSEGWLKTLADYARAHFQKHFPTTSDLVRKDAIQNYQEARLKQVTRATVKHERSALRKFCMWLKKNGHLADMPEFPPLEQGKAGKRYPRRSRVTAPPVSPDGMLKLIRRLPEWSARRSRRDQGERYPVRARFIVGYEMGLRPSSLDRLSVPDHWQPGWSVIRLTNAVDKIGFARDVPLTKRARRVLEYLYRQLSKPGEPHTGPLFGKHRYVEYIRKAANGAIPPEQAAIIAPTHTRSAFATHSLRRPGVDPVGVQYSLGHRRFSTTALYVKTSFEAALANQSRDPRNSEAGS